MHEEDDLPEPEHDHLLDHEFLYEDFDPEADAQGAEDEIEEDEALQDDLDDDEQDHPAWHDHPDD
ncbi:MULTISPECIES: hypothetical protein [Pseudomonas]|uniref:Uncharacterized protein n=2 Tax=Pseudomonas TaxID=286 RepID=A0AAD0PC70_PSEPU|nr:MULTISPECIES: hypothetical protein [Pseudomonas]ANC03892.1 hypothetical protein AB688_17900 [Pseudomonas putida]AXA25609.1 hypothetical protein C1S65_16340 [Pseudomonas putida]KAB5619763.1 hypothetical protein F7234_21450 [Pseudomonas putida]MBC3423659.1 hypothetical protein [Pseudomonas sp. RW3S2]MBC3468300.1 hypothetical protein [Pseudomonas sp. RW10S2]